MRSATPVRWQQHLRARPVMVVVGVVAILALPYLLSGPEIVADDWVWIRNAEFLGWWDAGGSRQAGRPGAFLLYALTFGLIGAHPLVLYLVQVALWAVAAICVLRCLRAYVGGETALIVTLLWLVLPSHTTLELWASTSQAWVALIMLAEGLRIVRTRSDRPWLGYALLAVCGTFYEVVIPVVPVGLAIADRLRTGRFRWQPVALGAALVAPALVWSLAASTVYPAAVKTTEGDVVEHLAASLALGLPVQHPLAYMFVAIAAVLAYSALRAARSPSVGNESISMLAGLAIVLAGTIVALRSYLLPEGIGNRVTLVSGVGAALFWVAARRRWAGALGAGARGLAVVAVLILVAVPARVAYVTDWIDTADLGARSAVEIADQVEASGGHLVLPDRPAVGTWSYALLDGWNTTAAAQVITGDPEVVVNVLLPDLCLETGPPASSPLAQYGSVGERLNPACLATRQGLAAIGR